MTKQSPPKGAKEGIEEQVDKLLNFNNLIDEDDYYQGIDVNKLDVLSDKLVALFQEQVKEIEANCNAVPDDQPNDVHIRFFNSGVKLGRTNVVKEIMKELPKEQDCNEAGRYTDYDTGYNQALQEVRKLLERYL